MEEVEIWLPIRDYVGLYEISNLGRVKSLARTWIAGRNKGRRAKPDTIMKIGISGGYYKVCLCKDGKIKSFTVHRLVWITFNGDTDLDVLHNVEGNKLDCRLSNLHIGTDRQNSHEYQASVKSTSQYMGISWHKSTSKWQAQITINGKQKHLGRFKTELEAAESYQNASRHSNIKN